MQSFDRHGRADSLMQLLRCRDAVSENLVLKIATRLQTNEVQAQG
jgi:hypothetical protein